MGIAPAATVAVQPACPQGHLVTVTPPISSQVGLQYLLPSAASQLQSEFAHFGCFVGIFPPCRRVELHWKELPRQAGTHMHFVRQCNFTPGNRPKCTFATDRW